MNMRISPQCFLKWSPSPYNAHFLNGLFYCFPEVLMMFIIVDIIIEEEEAKAVGKYAQLLNNSNDEGTMFVSTEWIVTL